MARGEGVRARRKRWCWEREVALGEEGGEGRGRWRGAARVARGSGSTINTTRFQAYGCHMYLFDQTFRTLS